jgi:hypothetical protein
MGQFVLKYEDRPTIVKQLAFDMSSYFVGPIPLQVFLDNFLAPVHTPDDDAFHRGMFFHLKESTSESAMFGKFVTNFIPNCELPFMGLTPTL